jgi:hypothetical protein
MLFGREETIKLLLHGGLRHHGQLKTMLGTNQGIKRSIGLANTQVYTGTPFLKSQISRLEDLFSISDNEEENEEEILPQPQIRRALKGKEKKAQPPKSAPKGSKVSPLQIVNEDYSTRNFS